MLWMYVMLNLYITPACTRSYTQVFLPGYKTLICTVSLPRRIWVVTFPVPDSHPAHAWAVTPRFPISPSTVLHIIKLKWWVLNVNLKIKLWVVSIYETCVRASGCHIGWSDDYMRNTALGYYNEGFLHKGNFENIKSVQSMRYNQLLISHQLRDYMAEFRPNFIPILALFHSIVDKISHWY